MIHWNLTMNSNRIVLPALTAATFMALFSCETQDPSALGEIQRDLAEAMAKNTRLEEEVSSLSDQLEEAKRQPAPEPETVKLPKREEIEKFLAIEGTKLQQAARDIHPNAQVEGFSTFDVKIPSFETPFSCKAKVTLREPSGSAKTLYWIGKANMKGEWTFEKSENLEPALAQNPGTNQTKQPSNDTEIDITLTDPVITPDKPAPKPAPAQPEQPKKPEVKYDIPLDNPVMKPGGR